MYVPVVAGEAPILLQQLSFLHSSVTSFRAQTLSHDDHVAFDVIAGDFNFDNMSPGEAHEVTKWLLSSSIVF